MAKDKTVASPIVEPEMVHVDDKKNFGSYWVKTGTAADGTKVSAAYDGKTNVYIGSPEDAQKKYPDAKVIS